MAKLLIFCAVFCAAVLYTQAQTKDCPVSSQMTICSPKCKDDTECFGQRCCPNICNTKSCAAPNKAGTNTGYKGTGSGATGTYCGNVKCNSYEKCELDRTTKRQKCVRT